MSEATRKAGEARALIADPVFAAVVKEIQEDAISAFLRPSATPADIEAAHQKVRAIATIQTALQRRIDDEAVEQKKDQHRGSD